MSLTKLGWTHAYGYRTATTSIVASVLDMAFNDVCFEALPVVIFLFSFELIFSWTHVVQFLDVSGCGQT